MKGGNLNTPKDPPCEKKRGPGSYNKKRGEIERAFLLAEGKESFRRVERERLEKTNNTRYYLRPWNLANLSLFPEGITVHM